MHLVSACILLSPLLSQLTDSAASKCAACDKSLPKLIEPRPDVDDLVTVVGPNIVDGCLTKTIVCKNTFPEGQAWLVFNQKEAKSPKLDEDLLAPCYKDPKQCAIKLNCNAAGKWTTKSASGKDVIVETLFCA